MKKAPAFQLYAADFYMDTGEWSVDEIGIYQRLLLSEWVNGSLPSDTPRLARIAGCGIKKFQKGWGIIQFKFIQNGNGRLINSRMEEVREEQHKYRELQREKAMKSWEDRKPRHEPQHKQRQASGISRKDGLLSSSSSSSFYKEPSKEEIAESSMPKIKEYIADIGKRLYGEKVFIEVHAFINKMRKDKKNNRAILHTLCRCYAAKPQEPWSYCLKVIQKEDGNYHAREYEKTHPKDA